MKSFPDEIKKQLRELYGKDIQALEFKVQKHSNKVDCGCFAIAWAVHIVIGEKPENITLDLIECFKTIRNIYPFPHTINESKSTCKERYTNVTQRFVHITFVCESTHYF